MRILHSGKEDHEILALLDRRRLLVSDDEEKARKVKEIMARVETSGDQALIDYSEVFDRVKMTQAELLTTPEEFKNAYEQAPEDFLSALRITKENIFKFHQRQIQNSWVSYEEDGVILGQRVTPMERVGLYVPGGIGGSTPLISSVLMNAIPAVVAGVDRIMICTPPRPDKTIHPCLLVAAAEVGVTELYKVGGAQAVAAMAFGTETIPRVDKIVGPGNIYVTIAKRLVYGRVGLDMLAGPSEILIIADETAAPGLVAADLLSQAEHDPAAGAILLTPDESLIRKTAAEIERRLATLTRKETIVASLEACGGLVLTRDLLEAVKLANYAAPEHLELLVADPYQWVGKIRHAGAIFLGASSPEAIGDYVAGPNHVLPTNGTARFSSGLSVDDFIKKTNIIGYTSSGLERYGPAAFTMARVEGLDAHGQAVKARMDAKDRS